MPKGIQEPFTGRLRPVKDSCMQSPYAVWPSRAAHKYRSTISSIAFHFSSISFTMQNCVLQRSRLCSG